MSKNSGTRYFTTVICCAPLYTALNVFSRSITLFKIKLPTSTGFFKPLLPFFAQPVDPISSRSQLKSKIALSTTREPPSYTPIPDPPASPSSQARLIADIEAQRSEQAHKDRIQMKKGS